MKPKKSRNSTAHKASKTNKTNKTNKASKAHKTGRVNKTKTTKNNAKSILGLFITMLLLLSLANALLATPQSSPPQQITAQNESDQMARARVALEDSVEAAEALLQNTLQRENGSGVAIHQFWAPLDAHLALRDTTNSAKTMLEALQAHGLTIITQDGEGRNIDQAEITLTVNGVSAAYQTTNGSIEILNIPIGSTVSLAAAPAPDTHYAFLRWEVIDGDAEISPFVPVPEIIMPHGMLTLSAIFDAGVPPVWSDAVANTPVGLPVEYADISGFSLSDYIDISGLSDYKSEIEPLAYSNNALNIQELPNTIIFSTEAESHTTSPSALTAFNSEQDEQDKQVTAQSVAVTLWPLAGFTTIGLPLGITWSVSVPSQFSSWISVPSNHIVHVPPHNNDSFRIYVTENTGSSPRVGTVMVHLQGDSSPTPVTVTQEAGGVLELLYDTWTPIANGAYEDFYVFTNHNRQWNVTSNVAWLTMLEAVPANRTGEGVFRMWAEPHLGTTTRTGTITVSASGVPSRTITVQQAPGAVLSSPAGTITIEDGAISQSQPIQITSNRTWTVTSNAPSWLTVENITPSNRTGNGSFTIATTANIAATTRTGTITVALATPVSGVSSRVITVVQHPGNGLVLNASRLTATAQPASVRIDVFSNRTWSVPTINIAGATITNITPTNRTGNGSFVVNFSENLGNTARTGTLTVTAAGSPTTTRSVPVTQNSGAVLLLSGNLLLGSPAMGAAFAEITSNRTWNISISNNALSWLFIDEISPTNRTGNGSFWIVMDENFGPAQRTGTITATTGTGASAISETIEVRQAGRTANLALSENLWQPTARASSATITVTSTATWTATSNQPWLTASPTSRTGSGLLTINAAANTTNASRTGLVLLTAPGAATRFVRVVQSSPNALSNADWVMYHDTPLDTEVYVTSSRVDFGSFSNVYMGMVRDMASGGGQGELYALSANGWVLVGGLTFSDVGGFSDNGYGGWFSDNDYGVDYSVDYGVDYTVEGFSQLIATLTSTNQSFSFSRPAPLSSPNAPSTLRDFFAWFSTCRIIFEANGGNFRNDNGSTSTTFTKSIARIPMARVGTLPPDPRRTFYEFVGWFTTPNQTGGTRVTENTPVTGNVTYWARWQPELIIHTPTSNGTVDPDTDLRVIWTNNPRILEYRVTLRNLTTGSLPIENRYVEGSGNLFVVNQQYLTMGQRYRLEITAIYRNNTSITTRKTVDFECALNGVFQLRNGSSYLTVQNGYNYAGTPFISAPLASGGNLLGQNMRLRYYPDYEAYTISAISSCNGFTRVMGANGNALQVQNRTLAQTQLFTITDTGGGQYAIQPKSNPSQALERNGSTVRLATYNDSAEQKWGLEYNSAYMAQEDYYNSLNWHWPVDISRTSTSSYGNRNSGFHTGFDIGRGGADGNPLMRSVADGIVLDYDVSNSNTGTGTFIKIMVNDYVYNGVEKIEVQYNHLIPERPKRYDALGTPEIERHETVSRGETIAKMGTTGSSTGVHLDLKVFISGDLLSNGTTTNPFQFFRYMRDLFTDTQVP
ncbi:MAG: InlB B-repeat-containing protein [Defluviitaleaceae bacterium]|nr:InlB B-repeat-containing protein [Defluviitaleaceae bacterium]